jgi:hypothetical protein
MAQCRLLPFFKEAGDFVFADVQSQMFGFHINVIVAVLDVPPA